MQNATFKRVTRELNVLTSNVHVVVPANGVQKFGEWRRDEMKRPMDFDDGGGASDEEQQEGEQGKSSITEYEKQRLRRIEENQAKLAALGLPTLASSFPHHNNNNKRKAAKFKIKHADNDYQPSTEDEQSDEDTEQKLQNPKKPTPGRRTSTGRPKGKKMKSLNSLTMDIASKEHGSSHIDTEVDDDIALQQALALSMGVSIEDAAAIAEASKEDSEPGKPKEQVSISGVNKVPHGKKQRRQTKSVSTIQLTEDEVIAFFFFFDEAGKGKITLRDLERVAVSHDFTWTKQEISEMINAFDKDKDGQLTLDDFRTIAVRCNMIGCS